MLKLKLKNLLDSTTITILESLARVATDLGIHYFVVGATARDILLTHVYGIAIQRATLDIDFAIAVKNWSEFDKLKTGLLKVKGFSSTGKMKQRLEFHPSTGAHNYAYPIDLIPFGGVENSAHTIAWPPEMTVVMNVSGYEEAYAAAEEVELSPGKSIRVVSLAGLILLKLFAWKERGQENAKDAQDLYVLLNNYADAGNADRIYGYESDLLGEVDYDPVLAGAILLGKDVARIASEMTRQKLITILEQEKLRDRLILHMAGRNNYTDGTTEKVERLLSLFLKGLSGASADHL
ncbi:nucleotidyl transferase AbiEii/AbiGii toxin family protein [Undibacterium sp. Di26W]|uniref:nucleotidyl transferase AbiEii/AbiGii toxin family protein n=1 Tax=Undibacterium sp. Di26W TaxID=3413035 RepID=UPI003BF1F2E7